jgi:hypothetical protein
MEQVNSRYRLRHTLNGGPPHSRSIRGDCGRTYRERTIHPSHFGIQAISSDAAASPIPASHSARHTDSEDRSGACSNASRAHTIKRADCGGFLLMPISNPMSNMSRQSRFHIGYWIAAIFGFLILQYFYVSAQKVASIP